MTDRLQCPWETPAKDLELIRLKRAVSLVNRKTSETLRQYVGLENIESWTGRFLAGESEQASEGQASLFEAGDVLFGKLRPYLAKVALAKSSGRCTSELLVLRDARSDARFLQYVLLSEPFIRSVDASTFGSKMPRADWEFIGQMFVPLPESRMQQAIACFLDRKTAAIDALIAKKEQLIKLLREKRQALITQAVTKGLNPTIPTKESRNPFLNLIPRHWEPWSVRDLLRMRHLEVQDGNHGELHPVAADYVDDGVPFLMANNVRGGKVDLVGCKFIAQNLADGLRIGFAREGDVLLTHKGTLGETAILSSLATPYAMLTPQVTYYRSRSLFERRYLHFFMTSEVLQEQLRYISSVQSTRGYVGITAQRDLVLLVPPLNEQQAISDHLEPRVRHTDDVLARIARSILGLREYRQALITAAVTGKIDVSKEAA